MGLVCQNEPCSLLKYVINVNKFQLRASMSVLTKLIHQLILDVKVDTAICKTASKCSTHTLNYDLFHFIKGVSKGRKKSSFKGLMKLLYLDSHNGREKREKRDTSQNLTSLFLNILLISQFYLKIICCFSTPNEKGEVPAQFHFITFLKSITKFFLQFPKTATVLISFTRTHMSSEKNRKMSTFIFFNSSPIG